MSAQFDEFSNSYSEDLGKALSVTGEAQDFYARGRLAWLSQCLRQMNFHPSRVLDFGCGVGSNSPLLVEQLGAEWVLGIDVSEKSITVAQATHGSGRCGFEVAAGFKADASFDLAFCNGVFHHIPPDQRQTALATVRAALRPGGVFAFWENNPWNPGTKYVMSRCVFDHDAITISPPEGKRLLREAGFELLRSESLFYFPAAIRFLRPLERVLRNFPLGGQYQLLVRNP